MSTPQTAVTSASTSGPRDLVVNLPPVPVSARRARSFVNDCLRRASVADESLAERLRLVASELVTNAVLHARTNLRVRLVVLSPAAVCLEVSDGAPALPVASRSSRFAAHGRGLLIVDALADKWGVTEMDGGRGKRVWAQIGAV